MKTKQSIKNKYEENTFNDWQQFASARANGLVQMEWKQYMIYVIQ